MKKLNKMSQVLKHKDFDAVVAFINEVADAKMDATFDKVVEILGDVDAYEDLTMKQFNQLNELRKSI